MCGQGHRGEHSGQYSGNRKDANLECHVHCGGKSNCQELPNPDQVRTIGDAAQAGLVAKLMLKRIEGQYRGHKRGGPPFGNVFAYSIG